ncbi:hypothetical protein DXX99_10735 [Ammonifex thiophilus]|uniref:ArsR family transcriptional regulator n=1 Tax=Ammonifex thiophilus TaxID=444093 RepID=A0A3D8P0Q9_9THEO|nr:hypothetical protein DXX99_10735 [Ammonifex thiophilus]
MRCQRCQAFIEEGEAYSCYGQTLCEDCYIELLNPPKACDPVAVASALATRRALGQSGTEGLTELQQKICRLIEERGKVTKEELLAELGIKPWELEKQLAVLRHCELVRAFKEENKVYFARF